MFHTRRAARRCSRSIGLSRPASKNLRWLRSQSSSNREVPRSIYPRFKLPYLQATLPSQLEISHQTIASMYSDARSSNKDSTISRPVYSSLDSSMGEIRLLRIISAASNNCILRCELSTFQLRKENPDYVAVSYVWGDPSITEDIVINGRLVPVTKNLALALRQFRDGCPARDHASLLWADAICIDQSNAEEKTHQVRLMPIIYERAACVMSWLGPCREELYGAMKSIRRLYAKVLGAHRDDWADISWMPLFPEFWTDEKLPDGSVGNRVWTEIDILMRNPYWSRSWIVQEMANARILYFQAGEQSLKWGELYEFWHFLEEIKQWGLYYKGENWLIGPATAAIISKIEMKTMKLVRAASGDFRVGALVITPTDYIGTCFPWTLKLQATDPRDKLFALYGLGLSTVIPDYSKDVRQVYFEFAAASIQKYGSPDILEFAGKYLAEGLHLPSWVPDWQTLSQVPPECPIPQILGYFTTLEHVYGKWAYGNLSQLASVEVVDGMGSLVAYGFKCAQVADVAHSRAWLPVDFLRQFRQREATVHAKENMTRGFGWQQSLSELQIFLRTIFMDINPLEHVSPTRLLCAYNFSKTIDALRAFFCNELSHFNSSCDFKELYRIDSQIPFAGFVHEQLLTEDDRQTLESYLYIGVSSWGSLEFGTSLDKNNATAISSHLKNVAESTSCFRTLDGDVGLGPCEMRVGDEICVLSKCSFPVILRRIGNHHEYIGPCFMLGLMEGEASRALEIEGVAPVEFDIR